jgi:signal transduction histidine kinase
MFSRSQSQYLEPLPQYKVTRSQKVFACIAVAVILVLGLSSILEARSAGKSSRILSNVESPAASIIFTQRETLVYATRLALWSNGGTSRREVQIARNLLAQRLSVIDTSGKTMGSRANGSYWRALERADEIVAQSPIGILPEKLHSKINRQILPVIDQILEEARTLVVSYQRSIDQEMVTSANNRARWDSLNLSLFYLLILFGGLFLFMTLRSNFSSLHVARSIIQREQADLENTQKIVMQLKDLDSAKNALISTVNHELRTPLTSIMGYIELLQLEPAAQESAEIRAHLSVLERNSQILLTLVESMLSLSKFDSAEGKLPDKEVSLNNVISDAIFTIKPMSDRAKVSIHFNDDEQLYVRGDVGQLNQVLVNLIANAIKFSPADSSIGINLKREEISAVITIADQGIGIPSDDIPYIFNRFFRAANVGSSNYHGNGLGLAIVEKALMHHNGSIEVSSELGVGTTFRCLIPLYQKEQADGADD